MILCKVAMASLPAKCILNQVKTSPDSLGHPLIDALVLQGLVLVFNSAISGQEASSVKVSGFIGSGEKSLKGRPGGVRLRRWWQYLPALQAR